MNRARRRAFTRERGRPVRFLCGPEARGPGKDRARSCGLPGASGQCGSLRPGDIAR